MATTEERMKILKMIQEGKISADDGIQLLQTLDAASRPGPAPTVRGRAKNAPPAPQPPYPPSLNANRIGGRWFRVLVTDTKSGKTRVNVRLPASMVSAGMKLGARFAPQVEGLDAAQLMGFLNSGEVGKIVDVFDEEDGEHVEVFIE